MTTNEFDGIVWRTSSYTAGNGACVAVGWRKSSYSGSNGECVEVGAIEPTTVAVRDSKHPTGPVLAFDHPHWRQFLASVSNP
jgi:hypothetical protein